MKKKSLRFRQVHLDFHTSPEIPGIGAAVDRKHWQSTLQRAHVDSITCFATCCHGWSYYPTQVGKAHPHLTVPDLLREQIDACKEIDVKVPAYITAGLNDRLAAEHPEWREIDHTGKYIGWVASPLEPGFRSMCFNTPYLDHVCALIRETAERYPDADGIFLDVVHQNACCCPWCLAGMKAEGMDPRDEEQRWEFARKVLLNYYRKATAAAKHLNPDMPVFHNSGHITVGDTEVLEYSSHLELESLPTGGWGYDHFPLSAAYARNLDFDILGMTGKFHKTWGEFGGYKHPNALRYECAAMLAYGSKCSVGDQLHPDGKLEDMTYDIIGEAFAEVEKKEPWCRGAVGDAWIAVLSGAESGELHGRDFHEDTGVSRMLLESHLPFDLLDGRMDFSNYKILILPDTIRLRPELLKRINAFLDGGGKVICSGESGLTPEGDAFALDLPARHEGESPYCPEYWLPAEEFRPTKSCAPFIMYLRAQRIQVTGGTSLGEIYEPYFNRTWEHYCSHKHAPCRPEPTEYDAGVMTDRILYFSHPVFTEYRANGSVLLKQTVMGMIRRFLGSDAQVETNLPSQGRVNIMKQAEENRTVVHLLYANTILRGGTVPQPGESDRSSYPIEIIEDLNPIHDVQIRIRTAAPVSAVTLAPDGEPVDFKVTEDGVEIKLSKLCCHAMVVLQHDEGATGS